MENTRVKAATEAVVELYWQGDDENVRLLRGALFSLYMTGEVAKEETDWSEEMLQAQVKAAEAGKTDYERLAEVTGEIADDTVLWLRKAAVETSEPFGTIVQQAAEFLHDFWSEIIE